MLTSSYIYKTSSKLPKAVVIIISIFNATVMFLIHPIALQMASQEASRLIMGTDTYSPKILSIIGVIATYFVPLFIYCYMQKQCQLHCCSDLHLFLLHQIFLLFI